MSEGTTPQPSASGWTGSEQKGSEGRTTSYPQGQEGKAPVVGELRTTSYKTPLQFNDRGYVTIN